jgi:hypothetical protein
LGSENDEKLDFVTKRIKKLKSVFTDLDWNFELMLRDIIRAK